MSGSAAATGESRADPIAIPGLEKVARARIAPLSLHYDTARC